MNKIIVIIFIILIYTNVKANDTNGYEVYNKEHLFYDSTLVISAYSYSAGDYIATYTLHHIENDTSYYKINSHNMSQYTILKSKEVSDTLEIKILDQYGNKYLRFYKLYLNQVLLSPVDTNSNKYMICKSDLLLNWNYDFENLTIKNTFLLQLFSIHDNIEIELNLKEMNSRIIIFGNSIWRSTEVAEKNRILKVYKREKILNNINEIIDGKLEKTDQYLYEYFLEKLIEFGYIKQE